MSNTPTAEGANTMGAHTNPDYTQGYYDGYWMRVTDQDGTADLSDAYNRGYEAGYSARMVGAK